MASRVIIKGIEKFGKIQFQTIQKLSDRQITSLALDTEQLIRRKINESLQRPGSTGNLAKSFYAERIENRGWGIGNISVLNHQAPYWRWINFGVASTGRTTPPTTIGQFSPGPSAPNANAFRAGRFFYGSPGFKLVPSKPIQAHNYIAKTLFEIPRLIATTLKRIQL